MKTADKGRTIVQPPKLDSVKTDQPNSGNRYEQRANPLAATSAGVSASVTPNRPIEAQADAQPVASAPMTQAEKEAEKFRKMKELLK